MDSEAEERTKLIIKTISEAGKTEPFPLGSTYATIFDLHRSTCCRIDCECFMYFSMMLHVPRTEARRKSFSPCEGLARSEIDVYVAKGDMRMIHIKCEDCRSQDPTDLPQTVVCHSLDVENHNSVVSPTFCRSDPIEVVEFVVSSKRYLSIYCKDINFESHVFETLNWCLGLI